MDQSNVESALADKIESLNAKINEQLSSGIQRSIVDCNELTIEVDPLQLHQICTLLRDDAKFDFNMLIDICGVDYLHYGVDEWETKSATSSGFERGAEPLTKTKLAIPRFAVVYHLLSLQLNHRIRIRAFLEEKNPKIDSVVDIWPAANWFEREAYDLFGISFTKHPDLRRLLTDYGFVGHPFRKDFPLIGRIEARYDAKQRQVIYEPVSIEPRVLEPKVIRHDTRYESGE